MVAVLALAACATMALAASKWSGAGWYQIEDLGDYGGIYAGPFATKEACEATLPTDDEEAAYYCQYLETKPSWDF
jgi:hypothetical protein